MNRRMRVLSLFVVLCFGVLVAQLSNLQVRQASALDASSLQPNSSVPIWYQPRGAIVTADGVVIADSVTAAAPYNWRRVYPQGSLYAPVTGYDDVTARSQTGLEYEYSGYLSNHEASASTLRQMLTEQNGTDNVITTIDSHLQQVAKSALAGRTGAVVAINPQTGAVLALYGNPTFDPNALAADNPAAAAGAYNALDPNSYNSPLVNYATDHPTAPGSTFKIITTAAIFDQDPSEASKVFPSVARIKLPETNLTLQNFAGEVCGGDLAVILARSCDTSYAQVGLDIEAPALAKEALAFGFNQVPPLDLPADEVNYSCFPPAENTNGTAADPNAPKCTNASGIGPADQPEIAYSAIGQEDVTETVLQDALIAAAIGDNGVMMAPHLVEKVVDDTGNVVMQYQPHPWLTATSPQTASEVRNLMLGVTTGDGTASGVFHTSYAVAAKTGTAETLLTGCSATWLTATAPAGPSDTPAIAVAALIPESGSGCSETGAEVAGPVVAQVMEAYLGSGE